MENDKIRTMTTWFRNWFLDNKVVAILLISLLILLNFLVFSKVMYMFHFVKEFLGVVALPIIMAGILFYLLNPLIDMMERKKIKRVWGIALVFVVISGLVAWGIIILIPIIREQATSLIQNWPGYWTRLLAQFDSLLSSTIFSQLQGKLDDMDQSIIKSITEQTNGFIDSAFSGIGSVLGTVTNVVIALLTMPVLLFFLLKDGRDLPYHTMKLLPTKMRANTYKVLKEINMQISQYIRGQLLVAFFVGLMFWIGLAIAGLEYAVLLAILAGVLNLVPYLGSFLAIIPIVIIALVSSPFMLVKVIIVFAVEQALEGRLIQPLILGSNLKIHPVTIIIVLLTAGKLFGVPGVILGIPAYAVIKVIVEHIFKWYKSYSGLYVESYNPAPKPSVPIEKRKVKKRKRFNLWKKR
ncbi:AI-2E family transporter [Sporosarcina sp. P21c]|uniref:AI-2E family transporter n=1 Tax=unclassified Sporosarcina TaxID=2647733 RepID=UPI000C167898|nr:MULTISPECIES: AI-2E family transporter [unclassified Sporosarcina]PIC67111.1 AI-2E family transporter [Sporosarcina sp. P16a]PIC82769.1 AI-2E family transporter [Sporosarcina sp. P1]PIC89596.1 AI-2E family transporter [Sporosarcina sp. P21c]PIC92563.1 AI-2E family transporter [Sporosarcina sp. P25]